jgi:ABC transporter DrrB family efflux protein
MNTSNSWLYTAGAAKRARPASLAAGLRHTGSLAWRSLVQIKHKPDELIDLSVVPLVLLVLFTYVFGTAIARSTHDYLQFVLPGVIVLSAMLATQGTGMGLNIDIHKGFFDRVRALPVARWAPLAGRVVADTVRQAWSMALLLGVGAILGFRIHTNVFSVLLAFVVLLSFSFAISWLAVCFAVLVDDPEKVQNLCFAVVFPMTFTSGAFVPKQRMPGWLQAWVDVNPATALVDSIRALLNGGGVASPTTQALLWSAALTAVLLPLAVFTVRRRV